ncbi:MAG TPA: iron-containing alcohol dehydrogenase [Chloroflexi bacterium]|nr:MAG: NAD-dependent alcohol dehydrogenase [Chloroflexota bacterium]HDD55626.1 iron-containing alcohol dehydrogenase [Chloroflexota bacterium]
MWHFVSPKIVFGESALSSLEEINISRALVVTDHNLVEIGAIQPALECIRKTGCEMLVFDHVSPDPTLESVELGTAVANDFQPDWIIGLGGGSPMDTAKAIWVLYERPDLIPAMINPFIKLGLREKSRLITIPTTSGTGADVTWAIVLTDTENNRKMGLGNRENAADIALVDPALASSMPPRLTADTGLDALTHAVEGFICTWHTDITDGLCLNAAREIFQNLPVAYEAAQADNPQQECYTAAREKMHNAATSAGLGFGNAMASLAHAMGHVLGSVFHIPHGRAVGLCLPYTIEFAARGEDPSRITILAEMLGIKGEKSSAGLTLAAALRDLAREVENPLSLEELGLDQKEFQQVLEKMVDDAFNDTQIITAPRAPSYQELEKLFLAAYSGQPVEF